MEGVVVEPGQTLWSIARSADPGTDARITVQRIMRINGLRGPGLAPGERLWVPRH
jgi:LysM repeat protein